MAATSLLKVQHEFEIGSARSVVATLSNEAPVSEVFEALMQGYRHWCAANESEQSSFQIFIHARSKDPSQESLLRNLVARWNAAERPQCPGKVEVWLGTNEQSWYGFTNATFPDDCAKRTQTVRYVTYDEMDTALSANARAREEREREWRRSNPVRNPIALPTTVASQLAKYLKLEFPDLDEARLGARDMQFIGESVIDGVPTQFWLAVASGIKPMWGVVERFEDRFELGFTDNLPAEVRGNDG
jgi:hypothetical protein